MHELSVAVELVELACQAARRGRATKVTTLRLRWGDLCGVAEEALRFAFEVAAKGTETEGASLEIERVPGRELELVGVLC
jgi:hydrogenase nickel incorporation protein HypA/HybF